MKFRTKLALVVLAGVVCGGASAAGSLEEWEITSTMLSGPMAMGPQKMIVCQKKVDGMQPPQQAQSDCKMTSVGGTRTKGTFTMECKGEHPSIIKGEGSQTADAMEGTMTIITAGMEMKQSYTGKRLGSCDKEGSRSAGGSGMPGMPGMDMQSMMDARGRPQQKDGNTAPQGAAGQQAATPRQPEQEAKKEEAKKEEPKDAAGKAVDAAKKALNGLLSF